MDALRGIGLILRTPRLWPLCLGPLVGIVVLYVLLGAVGGVILVPRLEDWLASLPNSGAFLIAIELLAILLWLLLFPFLFVLLGGVLFGLIFEPLSRATEEIALGKKVEDRIPPLTNGQLFGDAVARLALNGFLGLSAFLLGFALGPIPGVIAAALIGLLDYTASAYLRRGITLKSQSRQLFLQRPNGAVFSFGLVAGLLSLLPIVGVLLMPGLVVGGTLLVLRRESDTAPTSS
jgi:uncharacterized protein involved in cysteine biosynthesis